MIAVIFLVVIVATQPAEKPPDVVVLKELEALYQPVPFDHRSHAKMAEMWGGCTTCHHRQPDAATRPLLTQACRTCHSREEKTAEMKMPSLKAAYHRQCLNCHREWMHDNAASDHGAHRVEVVFKRGRDSKVTAASANGPKEIRVFVLTGAKNPSICRDEIGRP